MSYNIRVTLGGVDRPVRFQEIFTETKKAFLELVGDRIPSNAMGQFAYGTIYGGKIVQNEFGTKFLSFANGGFWNFSTINRDLMFHVYEGIAKNEPFAFGMGVDGFDPIVYNFQDGKNFIACHPGVIVRDLLSDGTVRYYNLAVDGEDFLRALEDNTMRKVQAVRPDIRVDDIIIRPVDGQYYKGKDAWVDNVRHPFNEGVFSIETSKEAMDVISCIGLGDLTHLGFGHVKQMEDPAKRRLSYDEKKMNKNEVRWIGGEYVRNQQEQ